MRKELRSIVGLLFDGLLLAFPFLSPTKDTYAYAFIVHPRTERDLFRKVPILKILPKFCTQAFQKYFWPGTVAPITGLTDAEGNPVPGYVIAIPMCADMMLAHRAAALAQIRKAVWLAKARGAKMVGLGALTSSLSKGGLDLQDIPEIGITTGHAYTGHNVTETLLQLLHTMGCALDKTPVAIVGAAGSIGSISAEILLSQGITRLHLIDIARKHEVVLEHAQRLALQYPSALITTADTLDALAEYPCIITATNTPDALIRTTHVSPGTCIIDDAQPSDVEPELFYHPEVLVLSAGAVYTPGIRTHFPMGLIGREDNYCCLAELLTLAHTRRTSHYVINRPTLDMVSEIAEQARALGFTIAKWQNEKGYIDDAHLARVRTLMCERIQ